MANMFSLCHNVGTRSSPAHRAIFSLGFFFLSETTQALGLSAQTFSILPQHNCISSLPPTAHCLSNAHQSFSETAAEVQDENHLKRGLSQQRSCWHGNGCLCEWRLLLRAWSEVSHCLMVQEDPVRLLYKFTKPGFILIFYYFL